MSIYDEVQQARAAARVAHENDPENVDRFLDKAKRLAKDVHFEQFQISTEMYIVWFCKTLQNWKALVASTDGDDLYYEVTYDGDKQQAYVDLYNKQLNVAIPDFGTEYVEAKPPLGDYVSDEALGEEILLRHIQSIRAHGPGQLSVRFQDDTGRRITESQYSHLHNALMG